MSLKSITLSLLLGATLMQGAIAQEDSLESATAKALESYRWFHSHPELSREEAQTSKRLASELRDIGLEVHEGVGGYGVLGVLKGGTKGPLVLYRADMDALPVTEETGLPYSSQTPGVMHACGHDIHMATALGTLRLLAQQRDRWKGTILFVGQPAEEVGSGAEAIIADPRFEKLLGELGEKPVVALALHDNAEMKAGQAALTSGYVTANVDSVDILVKGRGGHGARPSKSVDPIVIASEIVTSLQTIISRRLPAGTRAVVTVGVFNAGTKRNIIPSKALLQLTIRSYEEETRTKILEEVKRISESIAQAHGAPQPPKITHHAKNYTPAGKNDPEWATRLRPVFVETVGADNLLELPPSMVGEDFSEYSKRLGIPSVMFLVGTRPSHLKAIPGLHSSGFAPDAENTLKTSIALMRAGILEALKP